MTYTRVIVMLSLLVFTFTVVTDAHAASCPTPLVHRGIHGPNVDEDSLESIRKSVGVGPAEVDVQVTKDGYAILMHDGKVDRTTNGTGYVHDLTLAQVKDLRLEKSGDRVPTFREAVAAAEQARVRLVAEVKQYAYWPESTLAAVGRVASRASVRVYLGGRHRFATVIPTLTRWVYWRPDGGIAPTPSNAAEYGADLVLDRIANWTSETVTAMRSAGYATGSRLSSAFAAGAALGLDYMLTNNPRRLLRYCEGAR